MSFVVVPKPQRSPLPYQILTILIGSLVLFFVATVLGTGVYRLGYSVKVFPGVSVADVDLSNMSHQEASVALSQRLTFPYTGRIIFRDGDRVWVATPAELGMIFDIGASIEDAYLIGRSGGQFKSLAGQVNARLGGVNLQPIMVIDQRVAYAYLQTLAARIDQPAVEADLHINGTEVIYTPGGTGRLLDVDATMAPLVAQLQSQRDGTINLNVVEAAPLIQDASALAEKWRQALSAPLMLTISNPQAGDPPPWTIEPAQLAGMLSVQRLRLGTEWQYQLSVDTQPIQQLLDQIATAVNQTPQNARFYFDDKTRQLVLVQPAVSGRILDVQATKQAIQDGLLKGEHNIPLVLKLAPPQVGDDATAASLGITELVSEQVSYFRLSSSDRVQNIVAASARFHGLLIPPNTTFSMADALGDVSLENGYAEAPIIFNGRSILGVGGGLCQVSTTLFRTAFFGGYPIVERHYHAYRVLYYEQVAHGTDPNLIGLDATVYVPLVDLKFTNDRSSWLLMEVYVDTTLDSITWKFYSTEVRKVEVSAPIIQNVVTAPTTPLFVVNPDNAPGVIKLAQTAADGEDIIVNRTVYRDGTMLFSDSVQTHYEPKQTVCEYGPGTQNPQDLARQRGLCQP